MGVHGLARFTEDLDLFLAPSASNIECFKRALRSVVDDPAIDEMTADDLLGEAYAFADLAVDRVPFAELTVSVVSPRTLYEMKKDTIRLQDKADAQLLKQRFGLDN